MIYTSYFAKIRDLNSHHVIPISIALKTPYWFHGSLYKSLNPSGNILFQYRQYHDAYMYCLRYTSEILVNLDPMKVVSYLYKLSNGNDLALLCYETPDKFCHRHLVSAWLRDYNIMAIEWDAGIQKGGDKNEKRKNETSNVDLWS